jgi:photosystem II stability/assembly factor-like uncharacterized protein
MTRVRSFAFALPLCVLTLLGAGCFGDPKPAAGPDGGIFLTRDYATKWDQLKVLNLGTKIGSIAEVGTVSVAMDPQDTAAMYVGTTENGLMFSLNAGQSWELSRGLSVGRINAISVDGKNKCTVYAARSNQIHKTTTCGREWGEVYAHAKPDVGVSSLITDWFNPSIVYAGTTQGDILRSDDGAATWRVLRRVEGARINSLALDPRDSRVMYVATQGAGVLKTVDGGANWVEYNRQQFQDYNNARSPHAVIVDPLIADRVYHISKFGILRSDDGGLAWQPLQLPTPPGEVDVKAFAINPKDSKMIVYASLNALVLSTDGGTTWSSKKLPTKRDVPWLLFDTAAPQGLFLGTTPRTK